MDKMKQIRLAIILFIPLVQSQTEKYNIKDIVELDGVFFRNFSNEKVNGFVFKVDGDISIPLGMIKDGRKQGQWLEWSERDNYQENLELEELETVDVVDTVQQIPTKGIMSKEINEYISGETAGKSIMVLVSSQVVNYDISGAKVEESSSYYNPKGFLERRNYRKYEYEKNDQGQRQKIRVYNDQYYLVEIEILRYNEKGNIIEQIVQEPGGNMIGKVINDYDLTGKLVEHTRYGQDGMKLRSVKYFYGQNGKKTVEINVEFLRDTDGFREIKYNFSYDESGNVVTMDDELYRTYFFHDNRNNLIEAVKFLIDQNQDSSQDILVSKTVYRFSFY